MKKLLRSLMAGVIAIFILVSMGMIVKADSYTVISVSASGTQIVDILMVNGTPAYCIDREISFPPKLFKNDYTNSQESLKPETLFILTNSYPVLTMFQIDFLWGTSGISEDEAYPYR